MELFINKISHYLPDSVVPNSYFKEVNGLDDEWIYSRTGIKNRSKAAANENTNTMGIIKAESLCLRMKLRRLTILFIISDFILIGL